MANSREDGLTGTSIVVSDLQKRIAQSSICDTARRTHFRLAVPDDGEYIFRLRSNPDLGRYLTAGASTAAGQKQWLELYGARESAGAEAYFIIEHEGNPKGAIRVYDFLDTVDGPSFGWGSFIVEPPRPRGLVKASLLYVLEIGLVTLGFNQAHFEVVKENASVADFYLRSGAKIIAQSDEKLFLLFRKADLPMLRDAYADAWTDHYRFA